MLDNSSTFYPELFLKSLISKGLACLSPYLVFLNNHWPLGSKKRLIVTWLTKYP